MKEKIENQSWADNNQALMTTVGTLVVVPEILCVQHDSADEIMNEYCDEVLKAELKEIFWLTLYIDEDSSKDLTLSHASGFKRSKVKGFIYIKKEEILEKYNVESLTQEVYDDVVIDFRKAIDQHNIIQSKNNNI